MFRMFNGEKKEQTSKALIKTNSVTPQTSVNNEEQITPLLRKDDQLDEIDISSSPKSQALVHQDNGLESTL
ncbi:Uncharacterised protein [Legionella hackeliae]|uniref:hypothetical protein n=1 Tax=Legionella hackeliae TaxID=449 RepID=UPI000E152409|nr:hypothetical protein [Legionella hackeliae]STX49516.1 Uncharacterised protein [Legionella hackeliae]